MSKHKRLKAARRKQHNATAKERDRQWKADCLSRREQYLLDVQRRELEGCNVKVDPPRSKDTIEQMLDGFLDGGKLPAGLYHPDGTLDLFNIVKRVQSLGGLAFIDTEGPIRSREASS